jgi:hypothetical protein
VEAEPVGRVDDAEVDAEVVEALVHEARQHRGGAVEHVLGGRGPEGFHTDAPPPPLGQRQPERVGDAVGGDGEGLDGRVAADAAKLLAHDRQVFDPVTVGVDDRVVKAGAELPGLSRAVRGYRRTPKPSCLRG